MLMNGLKLFVIVLVIMAIAVVAAIGLAYIATYWGFVAAAIAGFVLLFIVCCLMAKYI